MVTRSYLQFLGTCGSSQVTCKVTIKDLFGPAVAPNNSIIQTAAVNETFLNSITHSNL